MAEKTRFTQNSGNGPGPQILVDARHLSDPALPEELVPERGAGKGRKSALAAFGLSPSVIKSGDPAYARCLAHANRYRKVRMREYAAIHGHVSAGVGALLASSSLALAASRFLYQIAASDEAPGGLLKQASQLADSARQHELASFELCAREGVIKRRQATSDAGQPWLLTNDGEQLKNRGGRPRRIDQAAAELDVARTAPVVTMVDEETGDEPL